MKDLSLNEIREKFLSFFESKGHLRQKSFPLIPQNDSSLLLINSGMAPLKPFFTGELTPPSKRLTTCQKCIRTPDIERVGKTSRHGTFFEMLGNFSFGDYFKVEATAWAWEFCTAVMKLPEDRLWVSIYEDDDETFDIWTKMVGLPPKKIVRLGKADNFWEIGAGPCGPCSEIYFDRGEKYGCHSPDCKVGCDCDRYVEFWNLVFSQYSSNGQGEYKPLDHPNIDTGMGLERLACIVQGVDNLFEVDTIRNIMLHVCRLAGISYKENEKNDVSLRVITDHIRSTTFMVCDGVLPSNEGRGYVLRKLLRRAARHGRLLGISQNFLFEVCDTVIKESCGAYPELLEKRDYIRKVITMEEEKFSKTIDAGLSILKGYIENTIAAKDKQICGSDAFKLYDTYGFPLDLTVEIASEEGLSVDEEQFTKLMNEQKEKSRAARGGMGDFGWSGQDDVDLSALDKTEFIGYENFEGKAEILSIIKDKEAVSQANNGENVLVILSCTPFYAESGGQVGDKGVIFGSLGQFEIVDTKKTPGGIYIHVAKTTGTIKTGESVTAKIDKTYRLAIMRNHSATHLLQKALRNVLGNHLEQAGSLVTDQMLRFDFNHFAPVSQDEISKVETIVNDMIYAGLTVNVKEMSITEAKNTGATALFGEKYGDVVRVVNMGDFSIELCGGTHVSNTAQIGLFKIVSEASVAAGVRRIEAVTAGGILRLLFEKQQMINDTAEALKTNINDIARRSVQVMGEIKQLKNEVEKLSSKVANSGIEELLANVKQVGGVRLICARVDGIGADALRNMADTIKAKAGDYVAVLSSVADERINFVAVCADEAVKMGAHAGNILKETAKIAGGGGGGRADSATAGGKDIAKLNTAMDMVENILKAMLK